MKEDRKADRFTEFDEDMMQDVKSAAPRVQRAAARKEAERRVYTIAAMLLGALVLVVLSVTLLIGSVRKMRSAEQAEVTQEDTLALAAESPMVLGATLSEVQAAEEDAVLNARIDALLQEMTLEDKAAGLFLITPEQLTGAESVTGAGDMTKNALQQYAIGGLVYSEKNLKSKDQVKEMLNGVSEMSKYPVFLAINENGEKRSAAAKALEEEVPLSGDALTDEEAARQAAQTTAQYLGLGGFNLNLSPVANLLDGSDEASLQGFAYSKDASVCASYTGAAVEGYQDNGVYACVKYFPFYKEPVSQNKASMYGNEFEPFRAAIASGVSAVMVTGASSEELSGGVPCAFSAEVVTDLLRGELGFDGIVITDALNAEGITTRYDAKQSVVAALEAGADVLYLPLDFEASYRGLLEAVEEGAVSEERIEESLRRIYRVKYR